MSKNIYNQFKPTKKEMETTFAGLNDITREELELNRDDDGFTIAPSSAGHNKGKKGWYKHKPSSIAKIKKNHIKPRPTTWIIIKPDGTKTRVASLQKYCQENELHHPSMIAVANGNRNHHKKHRIIREHPIHKLTQLATVF